MKLADLGHAFGPKKSQVVIDLDDPVIAHAIKECCTYVCDVMHKLGMRSYDPVTARRIASKMLEEELGLSDKWERYLKDTAPQMQDQLKLLIFSSSDSES